MKARRMPRNFRKGHGGDLACKHRDLSVCPACEAAYPEVVNVYGQCFWVADEAEREALRAEFKPVEEAS